MLRLVKVAKYPIARASRNARRGREMRKRGITDGSKKYPCLHFGVFEYNNKSASRIVYTFSDSLNMSYFF
jgi:hypothetical protein